MDIRTGETKVDGAQKGGAALLLAALVLGVSAAAGATAILLADAAMAGPVAVGAAALTAGVALAVMAGLRGRRDRSGGLAAGALVDALANPALIASPSGVPLHANAAYADANRALGFARLVSPLRWAAGDPAAAAGLYAALKRARAGETVTTPLGQPDPAAPTVAVRLSPVLGGEGGIAALLFVIEDMAATAAPEPIAAAPVEAVAPNEALFSQMFSRMPVAVGLVTGAGEVHEATPRFWRLLDRRETGSENGRRVLDMIAEPDRESVAAAIAGAAAGEPSPAPIDASLSEEAPRDVRLYVAPFPETDDAPGRAILYAVDTTEQRALEMQFDQSQKMQAVGQLAGGVAHDFNNILTAIIGFSDLLLMNHRPTDPSFQDIMNIKQNANRAAGLVKQLLAFSRRQTLRPSRLRLPDVLADLSVMLDRLLGEKVTLTVVHGRDLWPVLVDQSQLEQVITNLSVNARDAMPEGGRLTIRTANVPATEMARYGDEGLEGDHILIEVTDTGTGIPPDVLAKIYEPFFSTKEVGQGTGLGLSTVYGIVKQTGGTIQVDSRVGEGTTFQVLLPRAGEVVMPVAVPPASGEGEPVEAATVEAIAAIEADAATDAAAAGGSAPEPATPAPSPPPVEDLTGSATILLVEDEDTIRAFASRALEARGYRIHAAPTGEDALAIARELDGRIDLLVSDVVMPEMDGPTLAIEVKALNPAVPIIFMSGYAEDVFSRTLPSEMEFAFLPKPFSLKALATAVKEALEPAAATKH
ncbi:ATP-binding protein [Amorphus coralli]|uniref:ATP-binding protein n=1 Tax=Amorphus coralli TaxID=340680 RepID=UPI00041EAB69|nr:ATP-binding protein [Amorphus coralli]